MSERQRKPKIPRCRDVARTFLAAIIAKGKELERMNQEERVRVYE